MNNRGNATIRRGTSLLAPCLENAVRDRLEAIYSAMFGLVIHVALLIVAVSGMAAVCLRYGMYRRDYSEVAGSLYPLLILLVLYGVIPLQVHFLPSAELKADPKYYVLSFVVMSMGGAAYLFGFQVHRIVGFVRRGTTVRMEVPRFERKVIFGAIAAFDLYARLSAIASGTYFKWMAASIRRADHLEPSALNVLMQGTGPLLGAFAVYMSYRGCGYRIYFVVLFSLVLMQGDRGGLTYFVIASVLAWMHERRASVIPIFRLTVVLVVLLIGYNLVLDMRILFVLNRADAIAHPAAFVIGAINAGLMNLLGFTKEIPELALGGAGLSERTLAWAHTLAFQVAKLDAGWGPIGMASAMRELASVVPQVFWVFGDKPPLTTGTKLAGTFGSGAWTGEDPATTSFSSAYLFGGILGLVVFGVVFGLLQRVLHGSCIRWFGEAGKIVYIGSIAFITVRANSFAGAFVGARNFVVLLSVVLVLSFIVRALMHISRKGGLRKL